MHARFYAKGRQRQSRRDGDRNSGDTSSTSAQTHQYFAPPNSPEQQRQRLLFRQRICLCSACTCCFLLGLPVGPPARPPVCLLPSTAQGALFVLRLAWALLVLHNAVILYSPCSVTANNKRPNKHKPCVPSSSRRTWNHNNKNNNHTTSRT